MYHFELSDAPNELLTSITDILTNDSRVSQEFNLSACTTIMSTVLFLDPVSFTAAEKSSPTEVVFVPERSILAEAVVIGGQVVQTVHTMIVFPFIVQHRHGHSRQVIARSKRGPCMDAEHYW